MPDLRDLDDFEQGLPRMDHLPPTEIRRRGDRLRRRRTGLVAASGVLAAAVAIGAPVVALSGDTGSGRDVMPAPQPAPTVPPDGWLTDVYADFPLTSGFADEDATPNDGLAEDPAVPAGCGTLFKGFTDNRVVAHQGESEDREVRYLVVYRDARAAATQLASIRTAVSECVPPPGPYGADYVSQTVPADLGTEETFAFARQVRQQADGLLSDLDLTLVGRTGNALYVDYSYGAAGGDEVIAAEVARLTEASAEPLLEMCVYSVDPCLGDAPLVESEQEEGPVHVERPDDDIPADFSIGLGIESGVDDTVTGPDEDVNGVTFGDLCGTEAWPGTGSRDRLAVRVSGPEYGLVRELVTYADADQAAAVVDALHAALEACPADGDRVFTGPLEADTGYESALTFGMTYREGLGGGIWQVVRVGRAVLATSTSGEYGPDSVELGVPGLSRDNRAVTALMCPWTEAGC